jgi:hypothetical protein
MRPGGNGNWATKRPAPLLVPRSGHPRPISHIEVTAGGCPPREDCSDVRPHGPMRVRRNPHRSRDIHNTCRPTGRRPQPPSVFPSRSDRRSRRRPCKDNLGTTTVASRCHVIQVGRVIVRVAAMIHSRVVDSVHTGDQRCCHAGTTEYQPRRATATATRSEDRHASVWIGNGGYIRNSPARTAGVLLPRRLRVDGAATAACIDPCCFSKATRCRTAACQRSSADRRSLVCRRERSAGVCCPSACPPFATD